MGLGAGDFLLRIVYWVVLLLSLTVHEFAHAWSAWKLGDDTAARMGRLTLNPLAHMDPIGTVLLPLMGVPFGWAKPVPVNPVRFDRKFTMRQGMMITAAAGPLSNLLISVVAIGVTVLLFGIDVLPSWMGLLVFLKTVIAMNVILAVFNMLPIPPLDGSRVADGLMPYRWRPQWERFLRYGPLALLAVILLPRFLGISLFSWPVNAVFTITERLISFVT